MKGGKGFKVLEGHLGELISLVLVIGLAVALYYVFKAGGLTEAVAVGSSAEDLSSAVNKINECIKERGAGECTMEVEVTVSIPQKLSGTNPSVLNDPMWVIYHDYCASDDVKDGNGPEWSNGGCWGAPEDRTIHASDCECQTLWVDQEIFAPRCTDGLCWGLLQNKAPGESPQLRKEALTRLKPFYIIDPCYAVVKVRESPWPGEEGLIDICFNEKLDGPGDFNFCYSEDTGCILGDSQWPHDEYGVWSGDYGHLC